MLLFSTIFYNLIFDLCVKTRTRFSLRDKRLFEITEVEITRVDCSSTGVGGVGEGDNSKEDIQNATEASLGSLDRQQSRCSAEVQFQNYHHD